MSWTKRALTLLAMLCVAATAYGVYLYGEIRRTASRDDAQAADAIVILGAAQYNGRPSPVLKARLEHGIDLFQRRLASTIITTGEYGPDPNYSEAHVATQFLVERGIHPDQIITEQLGITTQETVAATIGVMRGKGWTKLLVVSDGFHLYRLKRMFNDAGITAYTSPAPGSPIETAESARFWHSMREVFLVSLYRWVRL